MPLFNLNLTLLELQLSVNDYLTIKTKKLITKLYLKQNNNKNFNQTLDSQK